MKLNSQPIYFWMMESLKNINKNSLQKHKKIAKKKKNEENIWEKKPKEDEIIKKKNDSKKK